MTKRGTRGSTAIAPISTQGQKALKARSEPILDETAMSKSEAAKAREQRLAAKLRENLKRRKGQARARADADAQAPAATPQGSDQDLDNSKTS
ncbi:MAG TPA: hypothetical protein VL147_10870 [Devosia sp.]|nr:hypothetical protein [Devosia sp.]